MASGKVGCELGRTKLTPCRNSIDTKQRVAVNLHKFAAIARTPENRKYTRGARGALAD